MKGATMGKPNGNASGTGMHDGWVLHSQEFGFMRTEAGENLVSFADLVQWLMGARETHRAGAVKAILKGITDDALPAIYFTSRDGPAKSFADFEASPWAEFAPDTPSRFQTASRSAHRGADLQAWRNLPKAERQAELLRERVAFELAALHDSQSQQDQAKSSGAGVAMLASKAGELWGYGQTAVTPAAPLMAAPDGWKQNTAFGFMRFDPSPAGRLVRLADVLRWLESSKELPRIAALDALCDALPGDELPWCYLLHLTEYAQPLPLDFMFWFQTSAQLAAAKAKRDGAALNLARRSNWVNTWGDIAPTFRMVGRRISRAAPGPTEPGRPALVKLLRQYWTRVKLRGDSTCDVLDDPVAVRPNSLAIRLDLAGELWGYGHSAQSITVVEQMQPQLRAVTSSQPAQDDSKPWSGEALLHEREQFKARGFRDYTQRTADKASMTVREVSRLIKQHTDSKKAQVASPFPKAAARKSRR